MKLTNHIPHYGRGWSYPPKFNSQSGELKLSEGLEDINESLEIILKTNIGERVMDPTFGCGMKDYIFEVMNNSTLTFLEDAVKTAIIDHEARIDVEEIEFDSNNGSGTLNIIIYYKLRKENSRHNFVFPFYINEANNPI